MNGVAPAQHVVRICCGSHASPSPAVGSERTLPVSGGISDPVRGIPHVTIGDGGNREQFAYPWVPEQPEWSALREYAYGYGTLA
eukprot:3422025-Prymnesium_polylepis.2